MILVDIRGTSHLANTLRQAAALRGFGQPVRAPEYEGGVLADLTFAAEDVLDHADLDAAKRVFDERLAVSVGERGPLVLVSQVPPGTTRAWGGGDSFVFYQVDTIIMRRALERAYAPEQIIVGCADPAAPLPLAYQEYLMVHECPVLQMSYESAEMAKCAINYFLMAQIRTTNELSVAAAKIGADWADVSVVLRGDARIGPRAYLRPGVSNQHLDRDVATVNRLRGPSEQEKFERMIGGA